MLFKLQEALLTHFNYAEVQAKHFIRQLASIYCLLLHNTVCIKFNRFKIT